MVQPNPTGRKRRIPEQYYEEVYAMFAAGMSVPEIHKKCREEWNCDVGERTVYTLIKELREIKQKQLTELIGADTADTLGRYRWLQAQLEEMAIDSRGDKQMFLRIADRLTHMYEFQLNFTHNLPTGVQAKEDHGREELLKELDSNWKAPPIPNPKSLPADRHIANEPLLQAERLSATT